MDSFADTKVTTDVSSAPAPSGSQTRDDSFHPDEISAVAEAQARLNHRMLDQTTQPFVLADLNGLITRVNRAFEDLTGYSSAELLVMNVVDITPERWRETSAAAIARVRSTGESARYEKEYQRKDGSLVAVEVVLNVDRDEHDSFVCLFAFVTDISARKRAEAALVASERRARALFEGIEDAVFVHDADGQILDANPAAARFYGYTHEEFLRLSTRDIDEPEFAAGFELRLRDQLRHGHLVCEGRHRTKDGRVFPVDVKTSMIQFDDHRAVLAVIRDITERRALEETRREFAESQMRNARDMEEKNRALTESEARYRQLTERSLDAIVVADRNGRITLFNHAAERTFGYRAEEILGQSLARLMPDEFLPRDGVGTHSTTRMLEPRNVGRTVEGRGTREDGEEFPLELSLSSVEVAGEVQYIGSIRDQTERQRMQAMLAQSDKLASIGMLCAGVAHEINNPLAYVGNNLAVLERDMKSVLELTELYESTRECLTAAAPRVVEKIDSLSEEIDWPYIRVNFHRMLARTREGVQRVSTIVQGLRTMARSSPTLMAPAPIADMFESALEMIRGRLRDHQIEIRIALGDVPRVVCEASQISQVILNLLINATQAIEAKKQDEKGVITFASHVEGDMAVLSVTDNGCGIEPEGLSRLFDPFYTTKPLGEGTGLGLSISHGIVSGHGGRIEVESVPGEGTCFRILLPLKTT